MKLLIITQTVDRTDSVLSFFHMWIEEFAKQCEQVTVICLEKGKYKLPVNVHVLSLGKESGTSRLKYLLHFYRYLWQERKNYDVVFVHMNPIYVLLGGLVWRVLKKKIGLWYTHGTVTLQLRLAAVLAHTIFTASKESFRIESKKVHVMGHGIDTRKFAFRERKSGERPQLISVGRISSIKRQDLAVSTIFELRKRGVQADLVLVGTPLTDADRVYEKTLREQIQKEGLEDNVRWAGSVPNNKLPEYLQKADVLVHTSETGSLDKVTLEAFACGTLVVSTSGAIYRVLPDRLRALQPKEGTIEIITDALLYILQLEDSQYNLYSHEAYMWVEKEHTLPQLVTHIVDSYRHE